MRRTEILQAINAEEMSGLDELNTAVRTAGRIAEAIERAPKLRIDPGGALSSMRNFTKLMDTMYGRGDAKTYALIEYIDDVTTEGDGTKPHAEGS